ncbi:VOC family protein [Saccharopolyspora sp. WRP15-2]|uniref:VOC family protein n=1 Tax=Saccharopolyspora oryzae TaxID=2997343 RepID=A0ABT4UU54_9PSEU|nr:VOC family protein [Saccharopolyspora oryzae]MDA3625259.1 VOC family protein [Saccharopolyspora oryzae]
MTSVTELAYIGIEASDLDAWQHFGVDLMGMQLAERTEDSLALRMDAKAHRWIVVRGDADDLAFTGFECATEADLGAVVANLRAAGAEVAEGGADLAAARKVERVVVTADPVGNRVELFVGLADADTPFQSDVLFSNFVTGAGGAGHEFLMERVDRQEILDWYGILGFKVTDYVKEEVAPGVFADAVFTRCNERHHSVAWADMPFPKRIHHFMIEVGSINDVGLAYDRCMDAKQPFEMTLGMHPNDEMFSFYVRTPSGFNIEYGWGGLTIDDSTWQIKHLDKLDTWGHRAPQVVADLLKP